MAEINTILLEILKRKIKSGAVAVEDVKDENYKQAVIDDLED